nr:unnamed protein product [Digitaria exilis]
MQGHKLEQLAVQVLVHAAGGIKRRPGNPMLCAPSVETTTTRVYIRLISVGISDGDGDRSLPAGRHIISYLICRGSSPDSPAWTDVPDAARRYAPHKASRPPLSPSILPVPCIPIDPWIISLPSSTKVLDR